MGGEVDAACQLEVTFTATVEDDCAVAAGDVEVEAAIVAGSAELSNLTFAAQQVDGRTVTVAPPDHKLVPVGATVVAADNCPGVAFALTALTSDEPDDAPGGGDGHTLGDIRGALLGTADTAFFLRAERQGAGDGRVYTAVYTATDGSGNEAEASDEVIVPKSAAQVP